MEKQKSRPIYSIRFNNRYGQGYWMGGQWVDGSSDEGLTHDPEKWLKKHNHQRVSDQCCDDLEWEVFENCETLEEAVKYLTEKHGMDEDEAESLWNDIQFYQDSMEEFDFTYHCDGILDEEE